MRLLVIGGGPGGYVAAIRGAQLGADVTLVEKQYLGGTCLNVGCIPTKALLHAAELYEHAKHGAAYGVFAEPRLDFTKTQARKAAVVDQLVSGVKGLMKANRIKVVMGTAAFAGKTKVQVKGQLIPFDKAIIATGSVPAKPPIPGIDAKQCINSTGALALEKIPGSMAIIGGGVIGVEMATIYATLGCRMTIVEAQDEILPTMDRELTKIVRQGLEKRRITILTGAKVLSVADKGAQAVVSIRLNGKEQALAAERILVSTGRKADTGSLRLDAAGVYHNEGFILTDETRATNVAGIYAVGDCTGGCMLAHAASAQGEVAAENAVGHKSAYDGKTSPSCVYTIPEFAGVGLTEEQAKKQGLDYIVGKFPLRANGKSLIMGESSGIIKILAGKEYGEILGVHIAGPRATDLIAEGALAIGTESTLDEIIATIHPHPTVSEAIREAALAAENRAIHSINE